MSYADLAQVKLRLEQASEFEKQRVKLTGAPAGGTFTLGFNGQTSAAIAYNASAAAMQAALVAMTTIGAGKATVSGGSGLPWAIILDRSIAVGPLTKVTNSLTGGSSPDVEISLYMQECLDAGAATLDREIGHAWGTAAATASTMTVYGRGIDRLDLPPHAGSVTLVAAPTGYSAPAYYAEQDGALLVTDSNGVIPGYGYYRPGWSSWSGWSGGYWSAGVPYTVTARWGWDTAPADVVESNIELAVRMWRAADAGFSDVVGTDQGGVGYSGALPAFVKRTVERYYQLANPLVIV